MCLHPIMIKNVNYGNKSKFASYQDTTAQYIPVPCGRCSVCLALKQQYLVQRVQMESLSHDLFFGTLTYNDECIPRVTRGEFTLFYADISDWQKMIKMIRKHEDLPPFKYMLVSEYGGKRHRPHFHFILSFPHVEQSLAQTLTFEKKLYSIFLEYWRRNVGSTRIPIWKNLCTFKWTPKSYNYDLHYLNPWSSKNGLDDIAFYVTKYCLKFDSWVDKLKSKLFFNLSESDYSEVWDLIRPRRLLSKQFGSVQDPKVFQHLSKGIDLSLEDINAIFPYFISPVTGKTFPLSPYYSKKLLTYQDLDVYNSRKLTLTPDDMMLDNTPILTPDQIQEKERNFSEVLSYLSNLNTHFDNDTSLTNLYVYGYDSKNSKLCQDFTDFWKDFDASDFAAS